MSLRLLATCVGVLLVLSSCAVVEEPEPEGPAIAAPSTPVAPQPPARLAPDWQQGESLAPVEVCQVPDGRPSLMKRMMPGAPSLGANGMSNVGFPLSPDIIPSVGVANLAVLPVTFTDLGKIPADPMEELAPQLQKMTEWSEFWSQGTFRYEFQIIPTWREISAPSDDYRIGREPADKDGYNRVGSPYVRLANAVVEVAGSDIDWSRAHGMLVYWPAHNVAIESSWGGGGNDRITTPVGNLPLFYWGTGLYHNTSSGGLAAKLKQEHLWSYWIHEMLHSQGVNGHAPGNGFATGIMQNQYPNPSEFSGALSAWETFLLGWIRDDQVHCIDGRDMPEESRAILTPLEIYGGERKMIVIRTGDHDGIVVESRRPIGYSERWGPEDSGLLVYALNLRVMNDRSGESTGVDCGNNPEYGKWAYYLPPNNVGGLENSCFFSDFIVGEGDTITHAGVKVELVFSGDEADYVSVTPVAP